MLRQNNSKNNDDKYLPHWSQDQGSTNRDSTLMDDRLDSSRLELIPPASPSSSGSTTLSQEPRTKIPDKLPKKTRKIHWPWCLRGESWTVKCWINFLILVVFALLLVLVFVATYGTSDQHQDKLCLTPICVNAASKIIESMDQTVDPCEDFYEYACGGWRRLNVIPDDTAKYSTFRKLSDNVQAKLKELLERPIDGGDLEPVRNIKLLYLSCINEFSLEYLGMQPLKKYLNDLGGWPVLEQNWNETQFDLVNLLARLSAEDAYVLINLRVGSDIHQSNLSIIQIDQASLGLPSPIYFMSNNSVLASYYQLAVNVAVELGASREVAERDMLDVVLFESNLSQIVVPDQERRNLELIYHSMTVGELRNVTEKFDWLRYLRLIFEESKINILENRTLGVFVPEYFQRLGLLLEATPPRTAANYVIWRSVYNKLSFLPEKFVELRKVLRKAVQGTTTERSRWKQCVNYVIDDMSMVAGRLFVDEHFDKTSKKRAGEMIEHLQSAFNELLQEVKWMNDETRKVAMEKVDNIREAIGYPDFILDDEQLIQVYKGLSMNETTLFDNSVNIAKWTSSIILSNLDKKINANGWVKSPAVVNAYYSASRNLIMFPAGILQPPFYHGDYPGYLNYGSMGMVIGHEITHGFDDKGRRFDKDGNMVQWWPTEVIKKFEESAECIINQYSEYTLKEIGLQINGHQTQGENIADNGGLKQAFRAYRSFIKQRGREEAKLPGLNLSPNQLFFLSFAQIWCQQSRPENLIKAIHSERHSPDRYRVIGSLVNSLDFADVYKCPSGSTMNPVKKCSVW